MSESKQEPIDLEAAVAYHERAIAYHEHQIKCLKDLLTIQAEREQPKDVVRDYPGSHYQGYPNV